MHVKGFIAFLSTKQASKKDAAYRPDLTLSESELLTPPNPNRITPSWPVILTRELRAFIISRAKFEERKNSMQANKTLAKMAGNSLVQPEVKNPAPQVYDWTGCRYVDAHGLVCDVCLRKILDEQVE